MLCSCLRGVCVHVQEVHVHMCVHVHVCVCAHMCEARVVLSVCIQLCKYGSQKRTVGVLIYHSPYLLVTGFLT